MRLTINYKLAGIILIIAIPFIGLSFHHYFELIEHDKQDVAPHSLKTAAIITTSLDDEIQRSFALSQTLSKHPAVIAKDSGECSRFFAETLTLYPHYSNIQAFDLGGSNYCSAVYSPDMRRLKNKESSWFR